MQIKNGIKLVFFVFLLFISLIPFALAPPTAVTGCWLDGVDNILYCNGTITGNLLYSYNASIRIRNAVIHGTSADSPGLLDVNSTFSWVEIHNSTINASGTAPSTVDIFNGGSIIIKSVNGTNITDSKFYGFGARGKNGAGFSGAGCTSGLGAGAGGGGNITLFATGYMYIKNGTFNSYGGDGGTGGSGTCTSSCACTMTSGTGGQTRPNFINITATDVQLTNSLINNSGGDGGNGGLSSGADSNCHGTGGNGNKPTIYISNHSLRINQTDIISVGGDGGDKGSTGGSCGVDTGLMSGSEMIININTSTFWGVFINLSDAVGLTKGTVFRQRYSNFTINVKQQFDIDNKSRIIANTSLQTITEGIGYINFTGVEKKFSFFNSSDFKYNVNITCNNSLNNLTVGNSTSLDSNIFLDYVLCGNPIWKTWTNYFNAAPTLGSLTFAPQNSSIFKSTDIIAYVVYTDENSDSGTIYFNWTYSNNYSQIAFYSSSAVASGTNVSATLKHFNYSKKYNITFNAWADDGSVLSTVVWGNVSINNSKPVLTSPTITPDPITESQDASASVTYSDNDTDTSTVWANWTVNGVVKKQATYSSTSNGTLISETLGEINYALGDLITVYFWANDGEDDGTTMTDTIVVNTPPLIRFNYTVPTYPKFNDKFNITVNLTDANNHSIHWVNFTIIAPNGSVMVNNTNGTMIGGNFSIGTLWNSTGYVADAYGWWEWNFTISDSYSYTTSKGKFDTGLPSIVISIPTRNYGRNWSIPINYTITDLAPLSNCSYKILNSSNTGQAFKDTTYIGCNNGTLYSIEFNQSLFDADILNITIWITANDSYNNGNNSNISILLNRDNSRPVVTITEPTGTYTKSTPASIDLKVNTSDSFLVQDCKYEIRNTELTLTYITNTSVGCNVTSTFSLSDYGSRTILFYAYDDANNLTIKLQNFTLNQPSGGGDAGGGGGGSVGEGVTVVVGENIKFNIKTDTGASSYQFTVSPGGTRKRSVVVTNLGKTLDKFELSCANSDICDWITLSETSFALGEGAKKDVPFTLKVPENAAFTDYTAQIKGSYKESFGALDISVKVSQFGLIFKDLTFKPFTELPAFVFPLWLFWIILSLALFILIIVLLNKKVKNKVLLVITAASVGIIIPTVIVLIIQ